MEKKKKDHIGNQQGLKIAGASDEVDAATFKWRLEELRRCETSIDYFAEHYFTIVDINGNIVPIKLYPKQSELLHKFMDYDSVIVKSPRQTGKSTSYSIFFCHKILFEKNYSILIAANKSKSAKGILKKIKDAYEQIPNWMKPGITEWNKQSITFDNGVMIEAEATSDSTGRSGTQNCICLDEFAFVRPSLQNSFWESVVPTISSKTAQNGGKGKAKLFVISTPNGVGDKYHEIWKEATTSKDTIWCAHAINWWEVPGRTEEWKNKELKRLGSEEAFEQEYGCSFTSSAGNKLISDEKITELQEKLKELEIVKTNRLCEPANPKCKWSYTEYFQYEKGRTYIGSVDVSEGTGRDYSVFYIFDITDGNKIKMCAKFDSNKIIPSEFAYVIYHMAQRYGCPKLLIESNSIGVAVIDALVKPKGFRYPNVIGFNKSNGEKGIFSHVQTKSKACLNVQKLIHSGDYNVIIPDKDLFKELLFFEKQSTSQHIVYKASGDNHDDHVMAFIWGMFVYYQEILRENFNVEYKINEYTKEKIPILIVNKDEELDDAKIRLSQGKNPNGLMSKEERFKLASKWKLLGDDQRAEYILSTIWQEEFDETGGIWGNNPYQLDPRKFSEGFFGDRYKGMGRDYSEPLDESDDDWDDDPSEGYGFLM